MKFLLPQGIGDSVWALTKVQDISKKLGDGTVEIYLNTQEFDPRENRSVEFIKRFSFVSEVNQIKLGILKEGKPCDEQGRFRYIDSGPTSLHGLDYILIPNYHLERGLRLEEWLPEFETNWKIMDKFQFTNRELQTAYSLKFPYCIFYMSNEHANSIDGHNREGIWRPYDWSELGQYFTSRGIRIIVVGAEYDESYWTKFVEPLVEKQEWINLIGKTGIAQTLAVIKNSKFVISFQSGIGIVAEYMGVPAAMFWRQEGNSISSLLYISFDEKMNGAWSPPDMIAAHKHLALYYGRHTTQYIIDEIESRGWMKC